MPLEFLKFVATRPMPHSVTDTRDARLARQCAAAGYLDLADPPAAHLGGGGVVLQVLEVLPEGYRAMELLDGFDKSSGFLSL